MKRSGSVNVRRKLRATGDGGWRRLRFESLEARRLLITLAPTNLTYSENPAIYDVGTTITNNVPSNTGGHATAYTVSPGLGGGLNFSPSTGIITGTPNAPVALTDYTVTAANSAGSTSVSLAITIADPPPNLANAPDQDFLVGSPITPFSFTNTGGPVVSAVTSPQLPGDDLVIDYVNGTVEIAGTPTVSSSASYTITAYNYYGQSCTATVIITTSTNTSLPTTIGSGTNEVLTAGEVYPIDTALTMVGGSLDLGGTTQSIASLNYEGGSLTDGILQAGSIDVTAGGTISANLSGPASLIKTGSGYDVVNGSNSFSGGVQVQGGTLAIASPGAILNGTYVMVGANAANLFGAMQAAAIASAVGSSTMQVPATAPATRTPSVASSAVATPPWPKPPAATGPANVAAYDQVLRAGVQPLPVAEFPWLWGSTSDDSTDLRQKPLVDPAMLDAAPR